MYCIYCGAKFDPYATACLACGKERAKATAGARPMMAAPAPAPDSTMRWLLPVGRSGYAIASGYLALFGLILPGIGLVAMIFGWLGLRDIAKHPEKIGKGRAWFGIVGGGLVTLLTVALLLLR
ncbi:DUF4190 domain-containing protein [Arenimonas sp.]|uniref:DUF4190 domain-containing protein n=1 Tax=Arenimonas sp. TaxID=1872635 RepID=UPI0039E4ABDE